MPTKKDKEKLDATPRRGPSRPSKPNSKATTSPEKAKGGKAGAGKSKAGTGGRKKKADADADEEEEKDDGYDLASGTSIAWQKAPRLTDALIDVISSDDILRSALFPPPGKTPSTAKGGGMFKSDAQYKACKELVATEEGKMYKDAFEKAKSPKAKAAWALKIKNRLRDLQTEFKSKREELGSTGEGIKNEAEINMKTSNTFVNKWKEVKAEFPWFFEMRDLVAERPNQHTEGLLENSGSIGTDEPSANPEPKDEGDAGDAGIDPFASPLGGLTPSSSDNEDDAGNKHKRTAPSKASSAPPPKKTKTGFAFIDDASSPSSDEDIIEVPEGEAKKKDKKSSTNASSAKVKGKPPGVTDLLAQDALTRQLSQKHRIARTKAEMAHTQADVTAMEAKKALKMKEFENKDAERRRRHELEVLRLQASQEADRLRLQNENMRIQFQLEMMRARNGSAGSGESGSGNGLGMNGFGAGDNSAFGGGYGAGIGELGMVGGGSNYGGGDTFGGGSGSGGSNGLGAGEAGPSTGGQFGGQNLLGNF